VTVFGLKRDRHVDNSAISQAALVLIAIALQIVRHGLD